MFAKIEDGVAVEFPVYEGMLEQRFPELSFPLDLNYEKNNGIMCPDGYVRVSSNTSFIFDNLNNTYSWGVPEFNPESNSWVETWIETPFTEEELEQKKEYVKMIVRKERGLKLQESDVFVTSDRWEKYSTEQKEVWSTYRQDLRDIPTQIGFPYDTIWPKNPAA